MDKMKKTKKNQTERTTETETLKSVKSFAELGNLARQLKFSTPNLESLTGLNDAAEILKAKQEEAEKIRLNIATAAQYLHDYNKQLDACKSDEERRFFVEDENYLKSKSAAEEYLDQVLALKGAFKSVAVVSYLKTTLGIEGLSNDEVKTILKYLQEREVLVGGDKGNPIKIGYFYFRINPEIKLTNGEIREISDVVEQFSQTSETLERQRRDAESHQMLRESEISFENALNEKNGTCVVRIPPESFKKGGGRHYYSGGDVQFNFTRDWIIPLRAVGGCEKTIEDIAKTGTALPRRSLTLWLNKNGELNINHYRMVGLLQQNDHKLSSIDANIKAKNLRTLWYMVRRAIEQHEEEKAQTAAKEEMTKKTDISARQWFGLNESPDKKKALLQFDGSFRTQNMKFVSPFFLAARWSEHGEPFMEVMEFPSSLEGLLGQHKGKAILISSCPEELADLMSGIEGQEQMKERTEEPVAVAVAVNE